MSEKKDLLKIYLINFMDLFAVGLIFPLLQNHLRDLGCSHVLIGTLSSIYSGLKVISGPIIGGWSDVRDRKSVLITTLFLCSLSYLILGLTNSLSAIIILRIILGLAEHTQTLANAFLIDILPSSRHSEALGKSAACGQIGFILGPFIGGHLSEFTNGFDYACILTGFLFIINILISSKLTVRKKAESESFGEGIKKEFYKSLTEIGSIDWKNFWDCFLLRFCCDLAIMMYFSQLSIILKEQFDLSQKHVGYTISYFGIVTISSAILIRYITSFYKNDENCLRSLSHFFVLMTVSILFLYLSRSVSVYLIFLTPFAVSCAVLKLVSMEELMKRVDENHRGSMVGASSSILSLAGFCVPAITGFIADKFGLHSTMIFASVPPLVGALVSRGMRTKTDKVKRN